MPKTSPFVERAVAMLTPLGPVAARAMFGGWGVYLDDLMFGLIVGDTLYFKVDAASQGTFAKAGGAAFAYERGDGATVAMSYWTPPAKAMASAAALAPWAERGLGAARRARASKAARPRARGADTSVTRGETKRKRP
jgi:DNA transformation protein and related proteins